jgi:Kef-type K+ transport system membrane component KefB
VDFATLALIVLVGILGPLLAAPDAWHLPVVFGELAAGVALGRTGTGTLHPGNPTFSFLAEAGFALVMFSVGSRLPVRDSELRSGVGPGALRALLVAAAAVAVGTALADGFGTGHAALYAVVLASSSAALVLPIIESLHLAGSQVLRTVAQVAVADAACIVVLPLAVDPGHAGRAAAGAGAVLGAAAVLFFVLSWIENRGYRKKMHRLSEKRAFALELRINLLIVFSLAALAVSTHVSVLLAGFSFGIVVGAIGAPRRLARQLFAITDGFLGPLFFVWLGASLDLRALASRPSDIVLGLALGAGAVVVHAVPVFTRQPMTLAVLGAAQLGVPVAAVTLGTRLNLLRPGEAAALLLGALISVVAATAAASLAARRRVAPS